MFFNWKSKMAGGVVVFLVVLYLAGFSASYLFYLGSWGHNLISQPLLPLGTLIGWMTVGLSVSLLSSLCAWPFALAMTTLLEHNKARPLSKVFLNLMSYMATMPLLLFTYVYIEVVGTTGFLTLKNSWVEIFASSNPFTKGVAFALTLLFYPLSALPGLGSDLSVDTFYQQMLAAVIEFAEVGFVASVIVLGLFLFVLPKMVLHMRQQLLADENRLSFEIIKSIGGTPWESIHLTVMQAMKVRFNGIITYFTRVCFFEGLITFTLLNVFFIKSSQSDFHWSSSLSSVFIASSMQSQQAEALLLLVAGSLVLCYLLFLAVEAQMRRRRRGMHV